jgi:putative addiction module component (TIGR02574 family)
MNAAKRFSGRSLREIHSDSKTDLLILVHGFALNRETRYDGGMGKIAREDILSLSVAERIELIGDLWDSLAETPEAIPLTEAQKAELERRREAHRKNPTATVPWSVVRDSIGKPK